MPGLPRRLSFSKGNTAGGVSSPSPTSISAVNKVETYSTTVKSRLQGPRCRRPSILKRTASLPAFSFAAMSCKTKAKWARNCDDDVPITGRRVGSTSASLSPRPWSIPERVSPPSTASADVTTLYTTMSTCSSTRAVISSKEDDCFYSGEVRNELTALTPCASMMAMYSGMMGGLGVSSEPGFPQNVGDERSQGSQMAVVHTWDYAWIRLVRQLKLGDLWSPVTRNEKTQFGQPKRAQVPVSPWVTSFQIFVIILLTGSLCRNVRVLLGW